MSQHLDMQDEFAEAVLSPMLPAPASLKGAAAKRADRRFAVYRNNIAVSLIEALGERFPVVKRLVGDEFFAALARSYALREPPSSPLLIHYGETFAFFIESFEPARPLPYLSDVARLEYARGRAYHAADIEPLPREAFAALDPERIGATKVRLHPSVSLIASAYPVLSIFAANRSEDVVPVERWEAEDVLVARPFLDVETLHLGKGVASFLAALQSGATIAQAAETAVAVCPRFDPTEGLATLIGQSLCVAVSG